MLVCWRVYLKTFKICQSCAPLFCSGLPLPLPSVKGVIICVGDPKAYLGKQKKSSITQRTEMFSFFMLPKSHIYFETKNCFHLDQTKKPPPGSNPTGPAYFWRSTLQNKARTSIKTRGPTWRIIPFSKWLITMVIVSPLSRATFPL